MKPLEHRFFPRGGFLSSQWNHIEKINDANMLDSFCKNNVIYDNLFVHQNKSRRGHQKLGCGLSA